MYNKKAAINNFEKNVLKGRMSIKDFKKNYLVNFIANYYLAKYKTKIYRDEYLRRMNLSTSEEEKDYYSERYDFLNTIDNIINEEKNNEILIANGLSRGQRGAWAGLIGDDYVISCTHVLCEFMLAINCQPGDILAIYSEESFYKSNKEMLESIEPKIVEYGEEEMDEKER